MVSNKDKIEQFKRELKSYRYYVKSIEEINYKLEELNTKMIGVGSVAPKEVVAGAMSAKVYHSNILDYMAQEERLIESKKYFEKRIEYINEVLDAMEEADSKTLKDIYIRGVRYDVISEEQSYSVRQMKRKVNNMIKENIKDIY